MKIIIAGGSGFIGTYLTKKLREQNHSITVISRTPESVKPWDSSIKIIPWQNTKLLEAMEGADVVINLCGAGIAEKRWTSKRKKVLIDSRLRPTEKLVAAFNDLTKKPDLFVQASAIGYYGTHNPDTIDESSSPGCDFPASLCLAWEERTDPLVHHKIRRVILRTAIVLASDNGAFPLIKKAVRTHSGGPTGTGDQWFPWIHIDDLVKAILFSVGNPQVEGPINLCSPKPITNTRAMTQLSELMGIGLQMKVPGFLVKMVMGERSLMYLKGQKALPKRLLSQGFEFQYTTITDAYKDLL